MADSPRSPGAERRSTLDPKVAERLQHLTLTATRAVEGFLAGRHKSPHRGVSVEFVERRGYVPGDDLRHLDWKAFARTDRLSIKRYEEETTLECTLVVDASASMGYPTDGRPTKYDHACQVAAALRTWSSPSATARRWRSSTTSSTACCPPAPRPRTCCPSCRRWWSGRPAAPPT
jgi:hypothetical protein